MKYVTVIGLSPAALFAVCHCENLCIASRDCPVAVARWYGPARAKAYSADGADFDVGRVSSVTGLPTQLT